MDSINSKKHSIYSDKSILNSLIESSLLDTMFLFRITLKNLSKPSIACNQIGMHSHEISVKREQSDLQFR
jgi:hypothetical protein